MFFETFITMLTKEVRIFTLKSLKIVVLLRLLMNKEDTLDQNLRLDKHCTTYEIDLNDMGLL